MELHTTARPCPELDSMVARYGVESAHDFVRRNGSQYFVGDDGRIWFRGPVFASPSVEVLAEWQWGRNADLRRFHQNIRL